MGEVRNIVFGAKDGRDYVIVASGGFFTAGKNSVVVPLKLLKVSQDRSSFYLLVTKEAVKAIPAMPDQDYNWLTDEKWRTHNDQLFKHKDVSQYHYPSPGTKGYACQITILLEGVGKQVCTWSRCVAPGPGRGNYRSPWMSGLRLWPVRTVRA